MLSLGQFIISCKSKPKDLHQGMHASSVLYYLLIIAWVNSFLYSLFCFVLLIFTLTLAHPLSRELLIHNIFWSDVNSHSPNLLTFNTTEKACAPVDASCRHLSPDSKQRLLMRPPQTQLNVKNIISSP